MDRNQPITTYRRDILNPLKKGYVSWVVSYSVDRGRKWKHKAYFWLEVACYGKMGNGSKEIASRWQNNSLCQTYVSWVSLKCKVLNRKTLPGETLCFLEKRLLSLFKFSALSKWLFSYELLIGPLPTFLECIVIYE